jgi:thymidylate synthase (FAD)
VNELKRAKLKVYCLGQQMVIESELQQFLDDHGVTWQTDTDVGGQRLVEIGGRLCYMSFGKGRKTNEEFIQHIIEVGHGSVTEHAVWNFIITGASRSFTHELIRHRHFSYSQLSQRYVDESDSEYVEPEVIANDPELDGIWTEAVNAARSAYEKLVSGLERKFEDVTDKTLRRKMARQG